ncbi:hypothetical protein YC2023_025715 [Brassica napus]
MSLGALMREGGRVTSSSQVHIGMGVRVWGTLGILVFLPRRCSLLRCIHLSLPYHSPQNKETSVYEDLWDIFAWKLEASWLATTVITT